MIEIEDYMRPDWRAVLKGAINRTTPRQLTVASAFSNRPVNVVLTKIMSPAGWHIVQYSNGQELLNEITKASIRPHLIILEERIPPMTARSLVQSLRSSRQMQPVIVASAYSGLTSTFEAYGSPEPFFLGLPFKIDYLIELMATALGQRPENRSWISQVRWDLSYNLGACYARKALAELENMGEKHRAPEAPPPVDKENIIIWTELNRIGFGKIEQAAVAEFINHREHAKPLLGLTDSIHAATRSFQRAGNLRSLNRLWLNAVFINSAIAPALKRSKQNVPDYCRLMTKLIEAADPQERQGVDLYLLLDLARCLMVFVDGITREFLEFVTSERPFCSNAVLRVWGVLLGGFDPWESSLLEPSGNSALFQKALQRKSFMELLLSRTNPHG